MKTTKRILLILFTVITMGSLSAQTAREIMDRASDAIEIRSMEMDATLKIYSARGSERVRETTTLMKEFDGVTKTLIRFVAPSEVKGTALLIYDYKADDDDIWIYMPALRKTRRIVSSEKGKSFMGSEFSNADMSRPKPDDFEDRIISSENVDGKECWKIESVCRNEEVKTENGFSRKISWIEKMKFLCHKTEFYDLNDLLFKIETFKNYQQMDNGKYFSLAMEMENVQNGRKSIMEVNRLTNNPSLTENLFTTAMLVK